MTGPQSDMLPSTSGTMAMPNTGQQVLYADPAMMSGGGMPSSMDGNYYSTRIILHPPGNIQSPAMMQATSMNPGQPPYISLQRQGSAGMHHMVQPTMPGTISPYPASYNSQAAIPPPNSSMTPGIGMYPSPVRSKATETRPRAGAFRKSCNCKNSRCLKLYCECFASGRYCDTCNCVNCYNNKNNEQTRQSAVEAILERNPNAFRPKIQGEEQAVAQQARAAESVRHTKGCNCKKSNCLKKYCECFQAGIHCSDNCKCMDCKNFEGSEARAMVIANQDGAPTATILHQAMPSPSPAKRSRLLAPIQHPFPVVMQQNMLPTGLMPGQAAVVPPGISQMHTPATRNHTPTAQLFPQMASQTPRSTAKEVVHKVVENDMISQLCNLLVLVSGKAAEAAIAEKQTREQARNGTAAAAASNSETSPPLPGHSAPAAEVSMKNDEGSGGDPTPNEDPGGGGVNLAPDESAIYAAQEKAVLEEFKQILLKIIHTTKTQAAPPTEGAPQSAQSMDPAANLMHADSPQGMPYMILHPDGLGPGRPQTMPPKRNLQGLQSLNLHQKLQSVLYEKSEPPQPAPNDAMNRSWSIPQGYSHPGMPQPSHQHQHPQGPPSHHLGPDPYQHQTTPLQQHHHRMDFHQQGPTPNSRMHDPYLSPRRSSQPGTNLMNHTHFLPPNTVLLLSPKQSTPPEYHVPDGYHMHSPYPSESHHPSRLSNGSTHLSAPPASGPMHAYPSAPMHAYQEPLPHSMQHQRTTGYMYATSSAPPSHVLPHARYTPADQGPQLVPHHHQSSHPYMDMPPSHTVHGSHGSSTMMQHHSDHPSHQSSHHPPPPGPYTEPISHSQHQGGMGPQPVSSIPGQAA